MMKPLMTNEFADEVHKLLKVENCRALSVGGAPGDLVIVTTEHYVDETEWKTLFKDKTKKGPDFSGTEIPKQADF